MLKLFAKNLFFVSMLLLSSQAIAGLVASLYDVDIPVTDESADVRNAAFQQALDEVFIRIAGDSVIMDKLTRPPASRYIKQFSYEPLAVTAEPLIKDGEIMTHLLKIQFNGSLMEKYLLDNGFPVWGEYRSDVVIWLVVRDGQNQYVLKDSDQSMLKTTVVEAMKRRGVPVRWPLYDLKDQKALNVAEIRGGFREPVLKASQRYAAENALAGSMIWNGSRWQSSWNLFVENDMRHWNLEDPDFTQLLDKAVDQVADALGLVFAVHNTKDARQMPVIQVNIQAVNTIERYRYVENYLAGLSAVDHVMPFEVEGDNAVFTVSLRSNEEDFLHLIKSDAELIQLAAPEQSTALQPVKQNNMMTEPVKVGDKIITTTVGPGQGAGLTADQNVGQMGQQDTQVNTATQEPATTENLPVKRMPIYFYRLNR